MKNKDWSYDYASGFQDGLAQGLQIHKSAMLAHRAAEKDLNSSLDNAVNQGYAKLMQDLDQIILKSIELRDTPHPPNVIPDS